MVMISRMLRQEGRVFLREPVTGNARDVEHRHQEHIQYLAVDDPNVALNINTPEDYTALHSG